MEEAAKADPTIEPAMPGPERGALKRLADAGLQAARHEWNQEFSTQQGHGHPLAAQGVDRPLAIADVKDAGRPRR